MATGAWPNTTSPPTRIAAAAGATTIHPANTAATIAAIVAAAVMAGIFDYGELRLLVLAMIAEQPRHGYELIKVIEERFGGSYAPSPGVIYPTLSWLEDMGYAAIEAKESGRKRCRITPEGETFLAANRAAADELLARAGGAEGQAVPAGVVRAMENLKMALRLRLRGGGLDAAAATKVAAALDAAALAVESS